MPSQQYCGWPRARRPLGGASLDASRKVVLQIQSVRRFGPPVGGEIDSLGLKQTLLVRGGSSLEFHRPYGSSWVSE